MKDFNEIVYLVPPSATVSPWYSLIFQSNQFIYSSNGLYAFGVYINVCGIFNAFANGSIGSIVWQYTTIPANACLVAQNDGNIVV